MRNYNSEIVQALRGGCPEYVPFTFYDTILPSSINRVKLQEKGLAICARRDVFRTVMRDVDVKRVKEDDGSVRTIYSTPFGSVNQRSRPDAYGSVLMAPVEHFIKSRDDYLVAEFIMKNTYYEPIYDFFLNERSSIGDRGYTLCQTCYSPFIDIQISWVGQEQFCYELADNWDAIMSLYEIMRKKQREMYQVVAESPAEYVLYGGNIVPEMIGPARVRDFILPCWEDFAQLLHEKGKKLGVHLDADNRLILDIVKQSPLDFVEAFTPPPDCSVSVLEARSAWPEKTLWINFPSSVHIRDDAVIEKTTRELLEDAGQRNGFLMGITEDIPHEHIERSVSIILKVIEEHRS
jgi:hypothetical protein